MNGTESEILSWSIGIVLTALAFSFIMAFFRLIRGPSLPDRVVALDLIATLIVGIISVHTISTNQPLFLQAGIVIALILFLGTVAFARYLEKRTLK